MIDDYYIGDIYDRSEEAKGIDKKNFYVGMITQVSSREVTVQIDNLSLLTHRILRQSDLVPNTINYYVVIDSITGIYFGQIVQNRIPSYASREKLFDERNRTLTNSEATVDVLGFEEFGAAHFRLPGFQRPGIAEKVYLANQQVIAHFISSIEVGAQQSIGSAEIKPFSHLSNFENAELRLKTSTLFDRHLLAVGATNSGKSTSALSILNSLVLANKKVLLIDPTGEYKNSFNEDEMKKLSLGVDTLVHTGTLSMRNWAMIFDCNENTQEATLAGAIRSLRYQKKNGQHDILKKVGQKIVDIQAKLATVKSDETDFDIDLLPEQVSAEAVDLGDRGHPDEYVESNFRINNYEWLNQKIRNQFENTTFVTFFGDDPTKMNLMEELNKFISKEGVSLYIDASRIGTTDGVGGMVVDLISNYLLNQPKQKDCAFVIFVDEVHRYARKITEPGAYYSGLTSIAREGRKKGIFLFLTTQNPNDVSPELLGQVGTLLVHRVTHQNEIDAIRNSVDEHSLGQIKKLNQGEAILTSVNLLEDLHISIDACSRIHENNTPQL